MTKKRKEELLKLAETMRYASTTFDHIKNPEQTRAMTSLLEAWAALKELLGEPLDPCGNLNCKLHYPNTRCARAGDKYGTMAA